jgi:outer membrane protein assembly factor BamB
MKLKRIARIVTIALAALVLVAVGLYLSGLRLVLDGGGGIHFAFPKPADQRAEELARHRESQRAAPMPPTAAASTEAASESAAPGKSVPDDPLKVSASTHWTDFRGPARDGHYQQQPIRTDWSSAGMPPMWKQPVGGGYASFVIARGRAFTIEQRGRQEVASAYDVATGRELWTNAWDALFEESMGGDGPRATPTWHEGRLYVLGAAGEFRALDAADGKMLWRTNILDDAGAKNIQWGMSAAPLVVEGHVIVLPGGSGGQSVVAYDIHSGKRAWGTLDDRASYSSPMLVTLDGVRQIVTFTATRLVGLSPSNGELLWEFPWATQYDVNASQPLLVGANRIFLSTGYGTGAALIEVSRGDGRFSVREVWRTNRMKNQFTSSVLHDGFIYGLDESILACLDASTGELKWKGGRYGYGQVMLASGHLIVLSEQGELVLVRATPERHMEIARFPALDGKTWNHPALSDGILLVRNINEMSGYDLRVRGSYNPR